MINNQSAVASSSEQHHPQRCLLMRNIGTIKMAFNRSRLYRLDNPDGLAVYGSIIIIITTTVCVCVSLKCIRLLVVYYSPYFLSSFLSFSCFFLVPNMNVNAIINELLFLSINIRFLFYFYIYIYIHNHTHYILIESRLV